MVRSKGSLGKETVKLLGLQFIGYQPRCRHAHRRWQRHVAKQDEPPEGAPIAGGHSSHASRIKSQRTRQRRGQARKVLETSLKRKDAAFHPLGHVFAQQGGHGNVIEHANRRLHNGFAHHVGPAIADAQRNVGAQHQDQIRGARGAAKQRGKHKNAAKAHLTQRKLVEQRTQQRRCATHHASHGDVVGKREMRTAW